MRIRIYTRIQALCLALSLFLGVFSLGLITGALFLGNGNASPKAVEAFAPFLETPLPDAAPTPPPAATQAEFNLFAFDTPVPSATISLVTPSPAPSAASQAPSPTPTATPAGGFHIEVIKGPVQKETEKKRILIYHTHTYEAYEPTPENTYAATEQWRTRDENFNVVRVGRELAGLLTAAGYTVTHDTTAYEPPVLATAYSRSLQMLEETQERGETYDLYIDLHRDAYSASMAGHNTVKVGDQALARPMMLIGKGTGQTGSGYFDVRPDWEANLAIAQAITDALNQQVPDLCRPVRIKTGRFNQHIAPCCVLIEVGNNKNTLEEALACVPYLADAIRTVLNSTGE